MKTIKVFYATALIAVLFLCYGCPPPSDKTGKGVKLVDTSTQLVKFDTLKKSIRLINSDDYISVLNFYDSAMSTISELCDESVQDRREHYIDSAEAVSHIYDFVRFFRTDANVALNGWSEITRDSLRIYETGGAGGPVINETQHCGLKIYFCYKSAERKYYLAYRNADNMDHDVDQFPIDAELIFNGSTCAGRFTDADAASPEAIANALFTMRLPACTEAVSTLDTRKVNDEANDFNDHINQVNRQHPGVLENPIAFFHKNQLDSLLTQNDRITGVDRVVAIRFFWGFHDIQFNKIKLVAFGVNGDGKNIFRKSDGKEAVILQRSWPPF